MSERHHEEQGERYHHPFLRHRGMGFRHRVMWMPRRRFFTKEERIRLLERYSEFLEKELAGVKERLEELKKEEPKKEEQTL